MCQCLPDALEPPNQKIKQCRMLLQLLCASLVVIGTFAILVGDFFGLINYLIYAYLLYIGWATFNWCILLMFFLFLFMQTIEVTIIFAGMIEYKQLFIHKQVMVSIYVLLQLFYCPTAIYISHYAYKHFKNLDGNAMGLVGGFMPNQPGDAERAQQQQQGQYIRMPQENSNRNQTANTGNNVFQGQGVRIG